jgi:hypothetical protein
VYLFRPSLSFLDEAQPRLETGQDKRHIKFFRRPDRKNYKAKDIIEKLQIYFVSFLNTVDSRLSESRFTETPRHPKRREILYPPF